MSAGAILLPSAVYAASGTKTLGQASGAASNTPSVGIDISNIESMAVMLRVTASVAPTTLDVYFQHSVDGGTTWDDFIHFTQVGAVSTSTQFAQWTRGFLMTAGTAPANTAGVHAQQDAALTAGTVILGPVGDDWRIKYAIAGTSYTFSVVARQIKRTR